MFSVRCIYEGKQEYLADVDLTYTVSALREKYSNFTLCNFTYFSLSFQCCLDALEIKFLPFLQKRHTLIFVFFFFFEIIYFLHCLVPFFVYRYQYVIFIVLYLCLFAYGSIFKKRFQD